MRPPQPSIPTTEILVPPLSLPGEVSETPLIRWEKWHKHYDHSVLLQLRLAAIQEQVAAFLRESRPGKIRILSLCSGDGRDVLPVVASHPRRCDVEMWFIDTDESSLDRGQKSARKLGIDQQSHFIQKDAGVAATYQDILPVDLVIISGLLGHLFARDALRLFQRLPAFCRPSGSVIWSQLHQKVGIRTIKSLRDQLHAIQFEELCYVETTPDGFIVSRFRFVGRTATLDCEERLFRFIGMKKIYQRQTTLGQLELDLDGWRGTYPHERYTKPIAIRVNGDDSGPDEDDVTLLQQYLSRISFNVRRLLQNPLTAWSYYPTHIYVGAKRELTIQLESQFSFLPVVTVRDQLSPAGNTHTQRIAS